MKVTLSFYVQKFEVRNTINVFLRTKQAAKPSEEVLFSNDRSSLLGENKREKRNI